MSEIVLREELCFKATNTSTDDTIYVRQQYMEDKSELTYAVDINFREFAIQVDYCTYEDIAALSELLKTVLENIEGFEQRQKDMQI